MGLSLECELPVVSSCLTRDSSFLDKVIRFFGLGIALYVVVQAYTWVSKDEIIKQTVKCKYCRKRISEKLCCFCWAHFI